MDPLKSMQNYVTKMVSDVKGMKLLLLDVETVCGCSRSVVCDCDLWSEDVILVLLMQLIFCCDGRFNPREVDVN